MKYKKLLFISGVVTVLLFITLIFVTVFRVSDVSVNYSVYSDEDCQIAQDIVASYKGKNLFFIDVKEVESRIVEETCLKVESVEKVYPYTLKVNLFSSEERFAISDGNDKYYVIDVDYVVLKVRNGLTNPADGLSDVLIEFQTKLQPEITLKQPLVYDNEKLFSALKTAIGCFESPRDRVYSVRVIETEEAGNYRLEINMRSGVIMQIRKATENTREKVLAGISKYEALKDNDLLSGIIECYEMDSGKIVAVYTKYVH